jgi:glycosyltransferase involved in cell wall biosynthesis
MRVLFDISVLGLGERTKEVKSGIYRVIQNLESRLSLDPSFDLRYTSMLAFDLLKFSLKYLDKSGKSDRILLPARYRRYALLLKLLDCFTWLPKRTEKFQIVYFLTLRLQNLILHLRQAISLPDLDDWNSLEQFQIFHSPFHVVPNFISKIPDLKVFVTVYDLIPLIYPEYFTDDIVNTMRGFYRSLNKETWILCISDSTKRDLLRFYGDKIDENKVFVTPLAASNIFFQQLDSRKFNKVKEKYGISSSRYMLSVSTLEPRKNLITVLRVFRTLVRHTVDDKLMLVLVGNLGWKFDEIFKELDADEELKSRVVVTGYVEDCDLSVIYSNAQLFIYPSFYEGFGLPPLEAMQCGLPVITSNTSSLPEVVGDAGILVDPLDVESMVFYAQKILTDAAYRTELSHASLLQAKKFSWTKTAELTVKAYQQAVDFTRIKPALTRKC